MRFKSIFTAATTALIIAVGGISAASADINLPTGNCGLGPTNNCLVFDDFNVYSLALLNAQPISPGDPYDVPTNGNFLRDALVIGTGPHGAVDNTDVVALGRTKYVDDAYSTPSAAGNGINNFQTSAGTANTEGSLIPGNTTGTWDVMVSDLVTYLDGGQLAFFFNLNQQNSDKTYLQQGEDALGWMAVTLTNTVYQTTNNLSAAQCALDTTCSRTFYLDGDACDGGTPGGDPTHCDPSQSFAQPAVGQPGNPDANILPADPNHDEWAYIHGQICMAPSGAVVGFSACAQNDQVNKTVNQNLGENTAAFALYSQLLQQYLLSGDYDKMSVDFRMAALTNGYEQLLIFAATSIPEPITLMMFAAGLLGLAGLRRRKLKLA